MEHFGIVLVSRTQSRLDDVKQEILRKSPNVEVRTIKFDFTNANLEDYKEVIVKQLNGLDKYVTWLTQILTKEFSDTGITFQVVNAAMVATKMNGADEAMFIPSPETFAKQALNSVGHVSETNGSTPKDLKQLAGANWAVVTGSTDGIGKAYALNLANRGFNIVLVSRTQSRLDDVKKEILRKSPNVEIRTIKFDFTNANLEDYKEVIVQQLNGLDVGMLVNNVGMYFEYPDRFDKISGGTKYIRDLTVVNILPVTILTAEILKQMVPRNKGVVINISSSSSYHTMRYVNIYSATKKYVTWLTQILIKEFSDTGITFQVVNAAMVATKMSRADEALFIPSPETFAKQALNSVGHVSETNGCLAHEIQLYVEKYQHRLLMDYHRNNYFHNSFDYFVVIMLFDMQYLSATW
uniref:Oxidoreductase, short chain dehydrogenase/reductase family protein n=1 Tax=Acrobeloides nanus TaxID=290746 RepID=A0A914DU50_9BILA